MFDFNHLAYDPTARLKTDFFNNASLNNEWYTWRKPSNAKFVFIYALGGGGAGGCSSNTVSLQRNGAGGGGGAGNISSVLIPSLLIPDILYVQVGAGGITPLVSGSAGANGSNSIVSVDTIVGTAPNFYGALAYAVGGFGGGAGGTAGGTAGAGGTQGQLISPNAGLQARGCFNADSSLHNSSGGGGTAGGAGTGGGVSGVWGNLLDLGPSMGGTGGGGAGNNSVSGLGGGAITLTVNDQNMGEVITAVGGAGAGSNGTNGWEVQLRAIPISLAYYSGTGGGGGNNTVSAGNGGNGARGSGGGGAGGTWSLNTLAQPGNGGDGLVYITSFF
jgi:hypothetical protein